MSVWICLYKPKILLLFGLMQRPITFPSSLFQPPVKIDISSSLSASLRLPRVMYLLSHLQACVYHPAFSFVILFFSPHILLSSSLSFFLIAPSVWSFLFLIFNPHSPSPMTHWKTSSSYWKHSEVVRDVKMKKRGRRWQWRKLKWEKGLCGDVFPVL